MKDQVGRHSLLKSSFRGSDGVFVDHSEIDILAKLGAKPDADCRLRLSFEIGGAKIDQVCAFSIEPRAEGPQRTFGSARTVQDGPAVELDQRDEERTDKVIGVQTVVQRGAVAVFVDWDADADISDQMKLVETFLGRNRQIENPGVVVEPGRQSARILGPHRNPNNRPHR